MKRGPAAWVAAARPKTLPAAVVPILVGTAVAAREGGARPGIALGCLGLALALQVGTNFGNDYYDHVRGADTAARRGPARAVASGWIRPGAMRRGMLVAFGLAFLIGLPVAAASSWWLVPLGLASIGAGWAYTGGPYPLAYRGWGDVFVLVFFGLVAVGGTVFAQVGRVPSAAVAAGLGVGALAVNLLVVNNLRDRATDEPAGKRTSVVRFGARFGRRLYLGCLLLAAAATGSCAGSVGAPLAAAAGLPLLLGFGLWQQLPRTEAAESSAPWAALLGRTAAVLLLYGLLLALGLWPWSTPAG